ncbi:putative bifunctional diguanylate cyclase/phosphodiesterase [Blastococcus saxobsidens]|uniref:Diguanylate cyclase (GGDEF)-like protein n=1 Tax=Blastococcus saxobsidens TaxID=138336 RepID=A0A4Q7YCK7_9ACTN|nr:bifunctional diguanylate cyclase/phosphodiesterase [Blastococcus saxobsidens]RZU33949.1 diguanylate cyclase (GGDEF)-like protein [Blastococcus saxobsidens]
MSRLFTSWRLLAAALGVAMVGVGVLAVQLQQQDRERALAAVVAEAAIINELLVEVELPVDAARMSALPASTVARIDQGVSYLQEDGRIVGLQLFAPDGRLLYSDTEDADPLSDDETALLGKVLAGEPQVEFEHDAGRALPTATVLSEPSGADHRPSGLVSEILLPQAQVAEELAATSQRLFVTAGALLISLFAAVLGGRRRLKRREHEALHDSLTGLGNRAMLLQADRALTGRGRSSDAGSALLLLDLDGFKDVNDTLGHAVGDRLLVEVAHALRASMRSGDLATRLGGDEFAVLLRHVTDPETATQRAREVASRLERPFAVDGVTLEVGVSIGVALRPWHGDDIGTLLQRADVAMYRAKREGSGVRLYEPADQPGDDIRLELLAELRGAIERGELRLHFQPKIALRTGRTIGFEALVRWQHPERGLLLPAAFLPAAERTALMRPLTDWVLREAIRSCAGWRAAGWDVDVAVNVSPSTLLDEDFPTLVTGLLAAEALPGHALELEITETAAMVDPQRTADTLLRLQAMGVRVSIDDFGAGYTSLSYLKNLPISALKVDRGFVTNLLTDRADEAVTRTVVQLAHDLGLLVVAEGVETAEVQQRLVELGCDEAQGYVIARPMEPSSVLDWLADASRTTAPVVGGRSAPAALPG